MYLTLLRCTPLLLALCLTGCGQTGPLFMRMPYTAVPQHLYAPPLSTAMTPILAVPRSTAVVPVSATAAAAARSTPAPAAGTHP